MKRIALYSVLLLLLSCSSVKDSGNVISRAFSAVDSARELVLAPNHAFEIVLASNPTTGYDWTVQIENSAIVQKVSQTFEADSSGRVGAGGNTTWTFQTDRVGKTEITFLYHRPWEKETPPTRVVTFQISVR